MRGSRGHSAQHDERGSAPAAVLAWLGLSATLLAMIALLAQGAHAQARAASAADLAALAAADALAVGDPAPCGAAAETARRNGADLTSCEVLGSEVLVGAGVEAGVLGRMTASARAGPGPPRQGPEGSAGGSGS